MITDGIKIIYHPFFHSKMNKWFSWREMRKAMPVSYALKLQNNGYNLFKLWSYRVLDNEGGNNSMKEKWIAFSLNPSVPHIFLTKISNIANAWSSINRL